MGTYFLAVNNSVLERERGREREREREREGERERDREGGRGDRDQYIDFLSLPT